MALFFYLPNSLAVLLGSAPTGIITGIYHDLIMITHKKKAEVLLNSSGPYLAEAINAIPHIIKINRN